MRRIETVKFAPSILAADFARLGEQVVEAERAGADRIHVDIMDGHFVPNITIGPPVVKSLRKAIPGVPFDCHLMIENPDDYIPAFAEAGANWISVHQEACVHLNRTLHLIASHGCKPAVVLNPATPVHALDEVLEIVHHVLVMSVNPGFGAQKFIPASLRKIETREEFRSKLNESDRVAFGRMPITRQERLLKIIREYPESVPKDLPDPFDGPQRDLLWRLSYSTRAGVRLRPAA